jgi:hypothetical protein
MAPLAGAGSMAMAMAGGAAGVMGGVGVCGGGPASTGSMQALLQSLLCRARSSVG